MCSSVNRSYASFKQLGLFLLSLVLYTHELLSQDEERLGLFVWVNHSIVVFFSQVSFPAWSSTGTLSIPSTSSPPMLLFSCKWECSYSVVILKDKEVYNFNTLTQNPSNICKVPFKCCEEVWRGGTVFLCERERKKRGGGDKKKECGAGFQVPRGVVLFLTFIYKVISLGARKTLLLFSFHYDFASFSKLKIYVNLCLK